MWNGKIICAFHHSHTGNGTKYLLFVYNLFFLPPYMLVELRQDQELCSSISCGPFISTQEAGNVVVLLDKWQAVDGTLVDEVLPVS